MPVGISALPRGPWIAEGLMHQPVPLPWLRDGGWEWTTDWQCGTLLDYADHGPATVVAALAVLAA